MTDNGHFGPDSDQSLPDQSELKPLSGGWPEIQDARLSKFLRTHLGFRRADQVPQVPLRSDIDPVLLGLLLSHVWLYRHDPDQDRFFCEFVGEVAKGAWRRPMMKQWADEIFIAADLLPITNRWKRVMTESLVLHAAYSDRNAFVTPSG